MEETKLDKTKRLIKKFDELEKTLKLMNRMCRGESLTPEQYDAIIELVEKRGTKTTKKEILYRLLSGEQTSQNREIVYWVGMYVQNEYDGKSIYYADPRDGHWHSVRRAGTKGLWRD